jgi:hypothetical protein
MIRDLNYNHVCIKYAALHASFTNLLASVPIPTHTAAHLSRVQTNVQTNFVFACIFEWYIVSLCVVIPWRYAVIHNWHHVDYVY